MARLALTVGGYVLGNLLLPGIGSALGGALGAYVGGIVDQQLFGPERETRTVTGPRLQPAGPVVRLRRRDSARLRYRRHRRVATLAASRARVVVMRCPTCFGTGRGPVTGEWIGHRLQTRMGPPCEDCGGTGAAHCCDGLTACNDSPEPDSRAVAPSRRAPQPTSTEKTT